MPQCSPRKDRKTKKTKQTKKKVRPDTIKLLEESIGKMIIDVNHSKVLFYPPPKIMTIRAKIKWVCCVAGIIALQ